LLCSAAARNKYEWPFASNSIWNLPIGANASYVMVNFTLADCWLRGLKDEEVDIINTPYLTESPVYYSSGSFSNGVQRCFNDDNVVFSAPLPNNYVVSATLPQESTPNRCASIVLADNNTIIQTQPLVRCNSSTTNWTTAYKSSPNEQLNGTGITGTRGGSGLSVLGGTIRITDIYSSQIRHVLALVLNAARYYYKNPCKRWPATTCDGWGTGNYYGGKLLAMRPGALLAIPANINLTELQLESVPGRSFAWTLQNFGAYVVDEAGNSNRPVMPFEVGPAGSAVAAFQSHFGYELLGKPWCGSSTAWTRDVDKIYTRLAVVDNWDFDTYTRVAASNGTEGAGGGAPLTNWAPPLE